MFEITDIGAADLLGHLNEDDVTEILHQDGKTLQLCGAVAATVRGEEVKWPQLRKLLTNGTNVLAVTEASLERLPEVDAVDKLPWFEWVDENGTAVEGPIHAVPFDLHEHIHEVAAAKKEEAIILPR